MKPSEARLDFGRPVAYYPALVERLGSVNAALFFCQIFFHTGKEWDPELGIYKSASDIQKEAGLSVDEQRTARKHLRNRGVLVETVRRLEHRIYYRLNLSKFDDLLSPNPEDENSHSAAGQFTSGELGKCRSYIEQEITTDRTSEKKTLPKVKPSVERCLKSTYRFSETAPEIFEEENELGDFVDELDPELIAAGIEEADRLATLPDKEFERYLNIDERI